MMLSPEAQAMRAQLRAFYDELAGARDLSLVEGRVVANRYNELTGPVEGVTWTPVQIGDLSAIWAEADGVDTSRVIQFHHGGGYMFGDAEVYRAYTGHLSRATGARVLSVDYRLVPEHPHPAPVSDAIAAYEWLQEQGVPADRIVFAGNSAGGGLSLGTLLELLRRGLPVPAGVVAMSPMADMTLSGGTWTSNVASDIRAQGTGTQTSAKLYAGRTDPADPVVSPVFGDYTGAPPLYISAGSGEVFLDDALRVAASARDAGVSVMLDVAPGFNHDYEIGVGRVPEADALFARIGGWVRSILP